jgi:adenosylcobinamide-GDP ribazoletransferase
VALFSPADRDILAAAADTPPPRAVAAAGLLGAIALGLCLGPMAAFIAFVLLAAAGVLMARMSVKAIGGHTGDVLGALEQVNEVLILVVAAARAGAGASA